MTHLKYVRRASVLLLTLVLFGLPLLPGKDKGNKDGFKVSGFVGTSSTSAANGVNVVLIDKATGTPVDSVSTGIFGKYTFKNVKPGTYIVKAEKVRREVTVVQKDIRMDIDLSAPGGEMDYMKGAMQQQQQQAGAAARRDLPTPRSCRRWQASTTPIPARRNAN